MFLQLEAILESPLTFPALECFHIVGLALGIGTIAVVDFSMLGWGLPNQKISTIASGLSLWTTLGIVLILLSGAGLFASDPDLYYLNPTFQIKMTLLFAALIFHFTVHQQRTFADAPAKWVAVVSLLLWASIVTCGIFTAFIGAPD